MNGVWIAAERMANVPYDEAFADFHVRGVDPHPRTALDEVDDEEGAGFGRIEAGVEAPVVTDHLHRLADVRVQNLDLLVGDEHLVDVDAHAGLFGEMKHFADDVV